MKELIRSIVLSVLGKFSNPVNNINILNGHFIQRKRNDNDKFIFKKFLIELKKNVDFVNVDEAVHMIVNREKSNKPLVAFTFDDGFEECYDSIAPVLLDDFNVNALFFVNTGYVEGDCDYVHNFNSNIVFTNGKKPMNYDQIKELSDRGFIIGNHTVNHIRLSENIDIIDEVIVAKQKIEKVTGKDCDYFAWPYGQEKDITPEQIEFLLKHHSYIFSGTQYQSYFFNRNEKVLNRRHFEGEWPNSHLNYFLSKQKKY